MNHRIRSLARDGCILLAVFAAPSFAHQTRYALPPPLPLSEAISVIRSCAPKVAPSTMAAITRHESRWRPYTIAVNGPRQLAWQPQSERVAVETAKRLMRNGHDFDMGFAQINVRNLRLSALQSAGITVENVLVDCYARARERFPGRDTTRALHAALSCYNTGDFVRGKQNGYVRKVYAARVRGLDR
jgi:type IV secretion system protein VirB1